MAADNNLDYYAIENIKKIESCYPLNTSNDIYVYIDRSRQGNPSHPYLLKIQRNASTIILVYEEQNSCDPAILKKVLSDILTYCADSNSELSNIVLWSHGSGWLPKNTLNNTVNQRSFGLDNTNENGDIIADEIDILDLAEVFKNHHFDLLIVDACFMGTIEFAYELRYSFDYLILSPSEILATGFPYDQITSDLVSDNSDPISIASKFFDYYNNQKNALQSATITVIDTKYLPELVHYMSFVYQYYLDRVLLGKDSSLFSVPQYDRNLSYFFFDFKRFVEFSLNYQSDSAFDNIWNKTVLFYQHTDQMFSSLDLKETTGLSIYIPNNYGKRTQLHEYYKKLSWTKDSNALILFE